MAQKVETCYNFLSKVNLGRIQSREIKALFKLKHLNLVKFLKQSLFKASYVVSYMIARNMVYLTIIVLESLLLKELSEVVS